MKEIVIVEDHNIVREGLKALLLSNKDFKIIADFPDSEEFFSFLKTKVPDIVILDIELPTLSGIEIAEILNDKYPEINKLILSANLLKDNNIGKAIDAGVLGILPKKAKRNELIEALEKVANGDEFYSDYLTDILLKEHIRRDRINQKYLKKEETNLSDREIEIIQQFAEGLTYKEIAGKLFISTRTVEAHKVNILNKLHLHTIIDLVKFAIKNNLILL